MKNILPLFVAVLISFAGNAQLTEGVNLPNIKTAQLFPSGNQLGYPVLMLNSSDRLEMHFDDLDGNVKIFSYTYQLCNADGTPAMLSSFDFIKGFSYQRISNYRISSVAF